jgi:hypothetical protein
MKVTSICLASIRGQTIVLSHCKLTRAGTSALAEVLGRDQGPTKFDLCQLDNSVLANGLRGKSPLRSLKSRISNSPEVGNRELQAIAGALRENQDLVDLNLGIWSVSDETWGVVCDSLKTHPTLEVLDLSSTLATGMMAPAVITSRIQSLLDMIKVNMSIHTINSDPHYSQHVLFREPVIPFLKTNRFRPRLLIIQKIRSIAYRAKVLGRALLSARTDANSFWMLLSGNPEVAFPSATATTTPAFTSLPTSAAAAATRAASTASASAAANVTTPASGQKRKTRHH